MRIFSYALALGLVLASSDLESSMNNAVKDQISSMGPRIIREPPKGLRRE